jgi:predicted ATPase
MRKPRSTSLPPPYLRRLSFVPDRIVDWDAYPFCLPLFRRGDFELEFETAITIVVGENGTGKSTLLEAVAHIAGFDEAGGGKGYRPVDHSRAVDKSGASLAEALRAAWLPKLTGGWFFRAESFYSVARYLDAAAVDVGAPPPDFLSHSYGEGFLRFFTERLSRRALYLLDEPESALSPARQVEFLKFLARDAVGLQIVMATHSPLLMACPGAKLLRIGKGGLELVRLEETEHFKLLREFCIDPKAFVATALASQDLTPDSVP